MNDPDLYKGFTPEAQEAHERYLVTTYGDEAGTIIRESKRAKSGKSAEVLAALHARFDTISMALADAYRAGRSPGDAALDPLLSAHVDWIAEEWGRRPEREAYAGLAHLYASHPEFRHLFETKETGFADWLAESMTVYAGERL